MKKPGMYVIERSPNGRPVMRRDVDRLAKTLWDDAETARLYREGLPVGQIAKELGVTLITVQRRLERLRTKWEATGIYNFAQAKITELAKIDHLEMTYWDAWERSQGPTRKTVRSTVEHVYEESTNSDIKESETVEEHIGDPAFLAGVQWCIDRRCKLLGLDAASKVEVSFEQEIKAYAERAVQEAKRRGEEFTVDEVISAVEQIVLSKQK